MSPLIFSSSRSSWDIVILISRSSCDGGGLHRSALLWYDAAIAIFIFDICFVADLLLHELSFLRLKC